MHAATQRVDTDRYAKAVEISKRSPGPTPTTSFEISDRSFTDEEVEAVKANILKAYRWQCIVSGVQHPRFAEILGGMTSEALAPVT